MYKHVSTSCQVWSSQRGGPAWLSRQAHRAWRETQRSSECLRQRGAPHRGSKLITRHLTLGRLYLSVTRNVSLAPAAADNYLWCMLRHNPPVVGVILRMWWCSGRAGDPFARAADEAVQRRDVWATAPVAHFSERRGRRYRDLGDGPGYWIHIQDCRTTSTSPCGHVCEGHSIVADPLTQKLG